MTWNMCGVLYLVVNEVPEISLRMPINAIKQWCNNVHERDPFCVVYLQNDDRRWHKGEYCYSKQQYLFTPVGMAAVPDVILMMELVQP